MDKSNIFSAIAGAEDQFVTLTAIKLCGYVLEDGSRLLTKDSVSQGLANNSVDENWLYDYLTYLDKYRSIDPVLLEEAKSDILFQTTDNNKSVIKRGITPLTLIEACKTIIRFKDEGFLFVSELKFAKAAEEILKNFAPNYNELIDFSSGYDLYKYNHKSALTRITDKKNLYYKWAITFPDAFYETIFQLKNWNWTDLRTVYASQFIHEITFSRLSNSLLQELSNSKPRIKHRKNNSFQKYLEHPELQLLIQTISIFIKTSGNSEQAFLQMLDNAYPILNENAYESIESAKTATIEAQFPQMSNVLKTLVNNPKITPRPISSANS